MISRKISYNILFVGLSKSISIGLAFYAIGLLSTHLGPAGFGNYSLALAYLGFMMAIADMGLHSITTREISREGADENYIINRAFTLRLLISGLVFVAAVTLISFLPYEDHVKSAIFVVAGAFMFSSAYSLLNSVFQKHIAMDRVAVAELIGKVIQMSIIITLIKLELPFVYSVVAILCAMISNFLFIMFFIRKYVKISLCWDTAYWKSFIREALPLGVSAIATFLYFKVDTIILDSFWPAAEVGIYGIAYKIIETLIFFPAMVIGLVFPLISRYILSDQEQFKLVSDTTVKLFILLLIPGVISLQFLAPIIINLLGGIEFERAILVLQILSLTLVGIFFGHLFMTIAIAANLQKKLMAILVGVAAFNIVLNIILIPKFSFIGAALSSVITEILVMSVVGYLIWKNTPFSFPLKHWLKYCVAALIMVSLNLILPFHIIINAFLAVMAYAVFIMTTNVITIGELRQIRPSNK